MTTDANSMTNKVCLVTGCNSGIGKVTALELAKKGATVVMACRKADVGAAAREEIKTLAGNSQVELLIADLSSQEAVRGLVREFKEKHDKLHVLINNAGVLSKKRVLTVDGLENQFALNLLAPFLLTHLLLDTLKASAPARIINVTSTMHRFARIDFDNLQGEKKYAGQAAYNQSKLGVVLFTVELARRLEGSGVTANCLHPGVVGTGIMRDSSSLMRRLWNSVTLSPEKGADTSVYLAVSPQAEGINGQYFEKRKIAKASKKAADKDLALKLWQTCSKLTGLDKSL